MKKWFEMTNDEREEYLNRLLEECESEDEVRRRLESEVNHGHLHMVDIIWSVDEGGSNKMIAASTPYYEEDSPPRIIVGHMTDEKGEVVAST